MRPWHRAAFVFVTLTTLTATALAEQPTPPEDAPADPFEAASPGETPPPGPAEAAAEPAPAAPPAPVDDEKSKKPGRGDFDAGGQVRLPNGPDESGEFATFNWIAVDLAGRYYLLDTVTVTGNIPLAVKQPEMLAAGDPRFIGGMTVTSDSVYIDLDVKYVK